MKELSKEQKKQRDALNEGLSTAACKFREEAEGFNSIVQEAWGDVEHAQAKYNEAVVAARDWVEAVHAKQQEYFDATSEKWQESDEGENYAAWMQAFENIELEEVELDYPDALDVPEAEAEEAFDALPLSPEA